MEDVAACVEVSIIGGYVNGPGASKVAYVGLPGTSITLRYVSLSHAKKVSNEKFFDTIEEQVKEQLEKKNSIDIIAKG